MTSWRALDRRASEVAHALSAEGVNPGDRVAFIGKGSDRFFELLFGAARLGAVLVPLQWRLAVPEAEAILAHCAPRLLFLEADQFSHLDSFAAYGGPGGCIAMAPGSSCRLFDDWRRQARPTGALPEVDPASAALQLYTSGTTGEPKGVVLSHANILSGRRDAMRVGMRWNEWDEGDVNLVALPLGHIGGVGWAIVGFFNGATTLIHAEFVPDAFLAALAGEGVSKTFLVPTAIQILLTRPGIRERTFPQLRTMLYGASPIALDLLREATEVFACEFVQQYGMTETCGTVVYLPPEDHDRPGTSVCARRACRCRAWNCASSIPPRAARSACARWAKWKPARSPTCWDTGMRRTRRRRSSTARAGSRPAMRAISTRTAISISATASRT
ncbi:AMP-binding protein [Novosphingobium sp. MBES04]|uniref:AMP-binding protein n=1 Tax=Novosphingobium sp. MBES04 TaxID=1206458 RepID=UPI0030EBB10D